MHAIVTEIGNVAVHVGTGHVMCLLSLQAGVKTSDKGLWKQRQEFDKRGFKEGLRGPDETL